MARRAQRRLGWLRSCGGANGRQELFDWQQKSRQRVIFIDGNRVLILILIQLVDHVITHSSRYQGFWFALRLWLASVRRATADLSRCGSHPHLIEHTGRDALHDGFFSFIRSFEELLEIRLHYFRFAQLVGRHDVEPTTHNRIA